MTKLSKIQTEILTAAIQAADGAAESPENAKSAVAGLIKRGLIISIPQAEGPSRLLITDAGRSAAGAEFRQVEPGAEADPAAPAPNPEPATHRADAAAPTPKPKGKIATLVELLRAPEGTTIDAMIAATGWQAHSVRGAISGAIKKGLGLAVASEKTDAGRRYRITAEIEA
jgi:hypothetical protein